MPALNYIRMVSFPAKLDGNFISVCKVIIEAATNIM